MRLVLREQYRVCPPDPAVKQNCEWTYYRLNNLVAMSQKLLDKVQIIESQYSQQRLLHFFP